MVTAIWMVDRVQLAFTGRQLRTYVHRFVFLLLVYCRCSEGCRMGCMIWVSECRTMEMDRRDISRYQRHMYILRLSSFLLLVHLSSICLSLCMAGVHYLSLYLLFLIFSSNGCITSFPSTVRSALHGLFVYLCLFRLLCNHKARRKCCLLSIVILSMLI